MKTLKCALICFAKYFHLVGSQYVKFMSECNECLDILKGRMHMCCYWAELCGTTGLQSVLTHVQRMQLQ